MHTYAVTYINNTGAATTVRLSAPNKFLLTVEISREEGENVGHYVITPSGAAEGEHGNAKLYQKY